MSYMTRGQMLEIAGGDLNKYEELVEEQAKVLRKVNKKRNDAMLEKGAREYDSGMWGWDKKGAPGNMRERVLESYDCEIISKCHRCEKIYLKTLKIGVYCEACYSEMLARNTALLNFNKKRNEEECLMNELKSLNKSIIEEIENIKSNDYGISTEAANTGKFVCQKDEFVKQQFYRLGTYVYARHRIAERLWKQYPNRGKK